MKVYSVEKTWVNWDGWPIASPTIEKTFVTEEKARQYMFEKTKSQSALDYGHVSSFNNHNWFIITLDVEE